MKMTDAELAQWNETFPPGSPCFLNDIFNGKLIKTTTRSVAWKSIDGSIIILIHGKFSGWSLDHVRMMETHKP